jgi:hypothetical protein
MKKLSVAVLLSLSSLMVHAQTRTSFEVICIESEKLRAVLQEEYKEVPIWSAPAGDNQSVFVLTQNEKTRTWTFLQMNSKLACILGVGDRSVIIEALPKKPL